VEGTKGERKGTYIVLVPKKDPLEDEENLIDSMNLLGQIARCKYIKSSEALFEIFNPVATQFEVSRYNHFMILVIITPLFV
jgi:hypothetical protein